MGQAIREERLRRRWTLRRLADRAGVSPALVQALESGAPGSLETYARVTTALDLRPELTALDPRRSERPGRAAQDLVHASMGELEARRLRAKGFPVTMDEPYQHYQFAGRADVVAWDLERRTLLHVENRTAFPNVQEALGSYAAKRSYLADVLAARLAVPGGRWASVAHCMVALWSAEAMHQVRLRAESFRSACPDASSDLLSWWAGEAPDGKGLSSSFVLLDPTPGLSEGRRFGSLDDALRARPRYRDYADAAARLRG